MLAIILYDIWIGFLVALLFSLAIFIHELGHFTAAKWAGVRVDKFAIGMGPKMFSLVRGETEYSLRWIPIGGFVLMAGERRSYNANTTLRDPAWRKVDPEGCLSIHPDDAAALGLGDGDRAICRSARGELTVTVKRSANIPRGVLSLPHGYGIQYAGSEPMGPNVNVLTSSDHRDPIAATPYHKYVPVRLEKCSETMSK